MFGIIALGKTDGHSPPVPMTKPEIDQFLAWLEIADAPVQVLARLLSGGIIQPDCYQDGRGIAIVVGKPG